jgi:hypothetical protein
MSELKTYAEKQALKATELPAFEKVALAGLRNEVTEMLRLIGHSKEIFATYTRHDISHIDAMLRHLDWLIPPSTQTEMTPVDWLLITLSIYFHDLGMLVTADEFENRAQNEAFKTFMEKIWNDPKSQDYLGRAKRMTADQQDRFFFQEFIRENHASRIKEWITGRHSRHWGTAVKPITEMISELMKPFPARFREHLATVCESHHRDNLNKLDLYPLCQRYGSETLEMANVQYAALILRTVDLIHVTKDRTPSITFKTIKLSDPKGVDEWHKQKDTFAVRHLGRCFSSEDPSTHVIIVSADFTEERPFFALTEYLAWADSEIKQSKRWSDQSRNEKDGEAFWFPWHTIRGDLRVEGNQPQQMRFEFDRGRLLDLLVGHAIYNDATVAIRELLQNSIDAVRFQHHISSKESESSGNKTPLMGKVKILWNPENRRLVIEDEGTGMDLDIIKFHLMRVGSSFYNTPQFASEFKGFTPISRFGIGVLTCFMISDDIEIITFKGSVGHRIRMTSVHADYLLREIQPGDSKLNGIEPHGTRVTLIVREGGKLDAINVEEILRHWIILPACNVEYTESGKSSVRIGFNTAAQALKSFYVEAARGAQTSDLGPEIITKYKDIEGERYEVAFAVKAGWLPEKTFAAAPSLGGCSAVCIEGISVSDAMPGFSGGKNTESFYADRPGIGALVSIREARGLRTTVSRSGLEEDEEYVKVGKICADMLFGHIEDELRRISLEKGKPLSRASTAGKWLCSDLQRMVLSQALRNHVGLLRKNLAMIVMELNEQNYGKAQTERKLVSPNDLLGVKDFWTIESRLVDSLGIISRDLGRELSLSEFLNALAPDYGELQYSPILPDAHLFSDDIYEGHEPIQVQYSRRYQQTAMKWISRTTHIHRSKALRERLDHYVWRRGVANEASRLESTEGIKVDLFAEKKPVAIAELYGDEEKIAVVHTRIVTILSKGSECARVWDVLQDALVRVAELEKAELYAMVLGVETVFRSILSEGTDQAYSGRRMDIARASAIWGRLSGRLNRALRECAIDATIPESSDFITRDMIFNASLFWRDWHRTKG